MKQQQDTDSNDGNHPKQQQHLRDDDERDENITVTATKKILSQLTDDEALVTEIRNMVLRGLLAPEQQQQQQKSRPPAQPLPQGSSAGKSSNSTSNTTTTTAAATTPTIISNNKNNLLFPSFWKMFQQEMRNISTNSSNSNDEKVNQQDPQQQQQQPTRPLAFTIAKESETYQGIMSTVNWYRDTLFIGSEYANKRVTERSLTAIEKARHRSNSNSGIGSIGINANTVQYIERKSGNDRDRHKSTGKRETQTAKQRKKTERHGDFGRNRDSV